LSAPSPDDVLTLEYGLELPSKPEGVDEDIPTLAITCQAGWSGTAYEVTGALGCTRGSLSRST